MKRLLEELAATAEVMGATISPSAAVMMCKDLSFYQQDDVLAALKIVRTGAARFNLKAIIDAVETIASDGRPGADEAWSMIPRDEYSSVVMTEEMAEAYGIAKPLLDEGDQVAARMAFKEAYTRIVDENKRDGVMPKWFPSLGSEKEGREAALNTAVRLGRIGADHAAKLLAPAQAVAMLESNNKPLSIEHKQISPEQAKANIARMKLMLGQSNLKAVTA